MFSKVSRRTITMTLAFGLLLGGTVATHQDAQAEEGAPFSLSVTNGKAKVGEAGTITVTVTAGKGHKANGEYPNKIKDLTVAGNAELAATTVRGSVSGKSIIYSVGVTPKAAGTHSVTGQIRFSICNETSCHIKKLPLDATITGE